MSHSFIQNGCCITASITVSQHQGWTLGTLSLHWSCLIWRCYRLMSDQLQADIVLQSMPLLFHLAYVIVAQDTIPKRGCRWPVIDNPHDHGSYAVHPIVDRLQLGWLTRGVDPGGWEVLTPKICRKGQNIFDPLKMSHSRRVFHAQQQYEVQSITVRGVDPGGWRVLSPLKICRRGKSMFWPPENVTFFHSKLLLYNWKLVSQHQWRTVGRGSWGSWPPPENM